MSLKKVLLIVLLVSSFCFPSAGQMFVIDEQGKVYDGYGHDFAKEFFRYRVINGRYSNGNGGNPVIIWNPLEGLETDTNAILSPATLFCHEADHALDDVGKKHKAHLKRQGMSTHKGFINDEEYRVVTGSEQKMAVANGDIPKGRKTRNRYTKDSSHTVYT